MRSLPLYVLFPLLLLGALAPLGCEGKQDPHLSADETLQDARARQDVDALEQRLPALLDALARREAGSHLALDPWLAPGSEAKLPARARATLPMLRALYAGDKGASSRWVQAEGDGLNDEATSWIAALQDVELTHGIFSEELLLEQIIADRDAAEVDIAPLSVTLSEADHEALSVWFERYASRFDGDQDNARLLAELLAPKAPLHGLSRDLVAQTERYATKRAALERTELALSAALVLYAQRMKFNNPAWQRDREAPWPPELAELPEGDPLAKRGVLKARGELLAVEALAPFFGHDISLSELLEGLAPPFEQYPRLIQAYARYQRIVEAGGWSPLPEQIVGLQRGASSPEVSAIKQRLRAEGMWRGDDSERFDEALERAVKHYQYTHQIWEKGSITAETWRSMNVPATRRLLRVRYALQRWRELRIGPDREYVYVNIPDFHGEMWSERERELRFKVVTGSAQKEWNPQRQRRERPRATKLFSDTMEYIVFNPYWNVPKGIVEEEILPKLEEEPEYLEENDYEWHDLDSGHRVMRQTPGTHNALGLVKFLFPNNHNIYLHDTNQKGFFAYPIRAFSHGCIRVQDPMELAEHLLKREGKWSEGAIASWTRPGAGEYWLKMEKPLPVHIEYVVARVDDEDHTHFLADIYDMEAKPMTALLGKQGAFDVLAMARSLAAREEKIVSAGL